MKKLTFTGILKGLTCEQLVNWQEYMNNPKGSMPEKMGQIEVLRFLGNNAIEGYELIKYEADKRGIEFLDTFEEINNNKVKLTIKLVG